MALTTDRDLLIHEPSVFLDATSVATSLLSATDGSVADTTLTSASSDFQAAGIDAGHVIVIGNQPTEVVARVDPTNLVVSLPRASLNEANIPPGDGSTLAIDVRTFGRMIAEVEAWILGALGIDAADPLLPLDETAILNPQDIREAVALRTIAQAFAAASALAPTDASLADRASLYSQRAADVRRQTRAVLEVAGGGSRTASRQIEDVSWTRSCGGHRWRQPATARWHYARNAGPPA